MEWPGDFSKDHVYVDLLVPGASSELDFEQFLKDTEEKLQLNANSIEQHLKELHCKMGTSDHPLSPTECLQWFNIRTQQSVKPAAHQDVMSFFRALQHYLKSEDDAKEVVTLQLLLNLSAQCGVCFPNTLSSFSSSSSHQHQMNASSIHLVHTVRDDTSLEIQEVWDTIRLQLRRYLLDHLSSHSLEPRQINTMSIVECVHCLQQLFFLYPESEVLTHYQNLRSQFVLDILHSSLSCNSGGETGFDGLTMGVSNVVSVLLQATAKELQVLSRLLEPQAILSFLNAAFFNTLTQEVIFLMEKKSETAQRDNTGLSSRIKKYSAKSRATVAPMDLPIKNRSFSLTSHQLRVLTQLACTMLRFESEVRELVTNVTFINCTGDTTPVKGILKKSKEEGNMTEEGWKSTPETPNTPGAQVLEFNWRSAYKGLAPHMEHCVSVVLDDVCAKNLQQEESLHSSGHISISLCAVAAIPVLQPHSTRLKEDSFYNHAERETPQMIAKFCGAIMMELDALLPLAAACSDSTLLGVRSSFVEACSRTAFAMLERLQQRALEVPSSAPLKNLPALLATCIYVHQRLRHYNARLKDPNTAATKVPLTLLPIQKYQDTAEAIREQLTCYCTQICATCILQDADSHHWADPKPFYEGERCSFSVQMWFYFLCGLRSDLWTVLSAELAKDVLGQVLSETLQLLVQRYARARPSYKRHLQIRCDITALLLHVEHLMWSVCESPEALMHSSPSSAISIIAGCSDWPFQIHSLCDQLLTVLVITTAPISLLYRTFMFNTAEDFTPQLPGRGVAHWLNAISPNLLKQQALSEDPSCQEALACQLRLLTSDPGCNPKLLLRMLLYRDCCLPRILLENSYFCQESNFETSTESSKAGDDFICALFNILSSLNTVPKALTHALQSYLEKAHVWEHLYTLADATNSAPVVISCIRAIVTKSINSLLVPLVSMVLSCQTKEEPFGASFKQKVPESVLSKIPKEWNYTPFNPMGKDTNVKAPTSSSIEYLSYILTNLPIAVASVPLSVRFLFHVAEKHLSHHARQLRFTGLFLWGLLSCLVLNLEDPDTIEKISGVTLDSRAKDCLSLLAECLQAAISIQQKGVPKPTVHKVLQDLEEKRPKWINIQLQKARKLCSGSVFEQGGEKKGDAAELTEQKIGLMLLEICHRAGGSNYLRQIYHIIQGNEEQLMSILGESTDWPAKTPLLVNFHLSSERHVSCFNPLYQFDHIGKKKLHQNTLVDWTWDWPMLLPAYRGMSLVTFKNLLVNR
ncbi:uncharacterized protein KIAA0825 homolog isoform X3 [Gouania willdenowi]|nr:uncharacterized protein KIAA0825 homolog isoform X3 [Gouania willdenowi]